MQKVLLQNIGAQYDAGLKDATLTSMGDLLTLKFGWTLNSQETTYLHV